jgi:hypothetical protein
VPGTTVPRSYWKDDQELEKFLEACSQVVGRLAYRYERSNVREFEYLNDSAYVICQQLAPR